MVFPKSGVYKGGFSMKAKRTWFYSPVLLVLLLVACNGASSDGQLIGEKITDWTATVSPGKVSSDKNEVHLHSKDVGPMGEVMATFTFVNDGTISGNGLSFQDGGKVISFSVGGAWTTIKKEGKDTHSWQVKDMGIDAEGNKIFGIWTLDLASMSATGSIYNLGD